MNVLFIVPRAYATYTGPTVPHLGVAYLVSFLNSHGHSTYVVDMCLGYNDRDLSNKVQAFRPQLVGITAYSFGFDKVSKLVDVIRRSSTSPIVIGGPHVAAFRKEVFDQIDTDFAIKGEGEHPLLALCATLEASIPNFATIPGLIWRSGKTVIENPDAPLIRDLNSLPHPSFDCFEVDKYIFSVDRRIPIATSRGCPYRCTYCSVQLSMGKQFRHRGAEDVVAEISTLYSKGWRYFDVVDDCFSMDLKRAKAICDLITENGMNIRWSLGNGTRADRMDEDLLHKMKKSGCAFVAYGLESGDDEILKTIRKGLTVEKALHAFELTRKVGIPFAVNFIIGHPTETYEKAMNTLRFASSIPSDYVNIYNLIPYPRTELFEWILKNGRFLVNPSTYLQWIATRVKEPVFETPEFTREERLIALNKGFALARKSQLRYRFGRTGAFLLQWPATNSEYFYLLARKAIFGSKTGRRLFNILKHGH